MARRNKEDAVLLQQISALENIIALQNGALDEIGSLIEQMPGGMVAKIVAVLERHGVQVNRPQKPLN